MNIPIFQIDAFTDQVFGGNPAAVCVLEEWLDAEIMQKIAAENNLAETAFVVAEGNNYAIRWFTPTVEVDLCGHATLASAYVLFNEYDYASDKIIFHSLNSGELSVEQEGNLLTLDFPADELQEISAPEVFTSLGKDPIAAYQGKTDFMLVYASQEDIEELEPDFMAMKKVQARGIIVTAPGNEVDFVSRFFAPQSGIDEDPVTGSAHTSLTPFWSKQLNKTTLTAQQVSPRKGVLTCELQDDRVKISGQAVSYLKGTINI